MSSIGPIAAAATSHANAQLAQQASVAVAGKVQDAARAEGEAVVALIQDAAAVANGSTTGSGQRLDVHA